MVGAYVDYYTYPPIMMIFPVVYLCAFLFCPDTPQQLLKQKRMAAAERSLRFYRNAHYDERNDAGGERERAFQAELWKLQQIAVQNAQAPALSVGDFREWLQHFCYRNTFSERYLKLAASKHSETILERFFV